MNLNVQVFIHYNLHEIFRIKPQIEITITCKYKQYQKIKDHIEKNTRHQDLTWFTQSLGYVHQTTSPILLQSNDYNLITIRNPL